MLTQCPHCKNQAEMPDSRFLQEVACSKCGKKFRATAFVKTEDEELLGFAYCDYCGAKHRIRRTNENIIGKPVRCSKCKEFFNVVLANPTEEDIAVEKVMAEAEVEKLPDELKEIWKKIIELGIKATISGTWIWIDDPKDQASELKKMGFKWSQKRSSYYLPEKKKNKKSRKKTVSDEKGCASDTEGTDEFLIRKVNENLIRKVKKGFKPHIARLNTIAKKSENETRRWCIDVMKDGLGYKDEDLETELNVLGLRVDIAVKQKDKVVLIVECKAGNIKLTPSHANQAARYAMNLGIPWAVLTNGNSWKLFYVSRSEGDTPNCTLVFDIALLDEDGLSETDAFYLSLLIPQNLESGETLWWAHFEACSSYPRLVKSLLSDKIIDVINTEILAAYEKETGFKPDFDIREVIKDNLEDIFAGDEL